MKFRYYITDLFEGAVTGTDNTEHAEAFACSEDWFVVDSETGEWLQPEGVRVEVPPSPVIASE